MANLQTEAFRYLALEPSKVTPTVTAQNKKSRYHASFTPKASRIPIDLKTVIVAKKTMAETTERMQTLLLSRSINSPKTKSRFRPKDPQQQEQQLESIPATMSEKDASPTLTATDYSRDFQMVNLNFAGDVNMRPPSEHFNELPEEISKVINANETPGERFTPPEPFYRQIDNPSEAENKNGWSPVVPKNVTQEKFYITTKGEGRPLF